MKNIVLGITVLLSTIGCARNGAMNYNHGVLPPEIRQEVVDNTTKVFAGIPILFGTEGSAARINDKWLISAKHNNGMFPFRDVFLHPTCDVMLVREDGDNILSKGTGVVKDDSTLYHVGYPMFPSILKAVNKGVFGMYVEDQHGCLYATSTAPVMSGMSGGAVVSEEGELLGVTTGIASINYDDGSKGNNVTTFITIESVKEWIESVLKRGNK